MRRIVTLVVAVVATLVLGLAGNAAASCSTHTYFYQGQMVTCTTCCFGHNCTTTCF
jgi:hypothetical protein